MDAPVARTGGKRAKREVTVHVRLTEDALAYIDALAARDERTRSDMIRVLLRKGMERS
jgi:metal-responsive CopG/Arc/MetJ family transcriptional regulator